MKCPKCGYEIPNPPKAFGVSKKSYLIPSKEIISCPQCRTIVEIIWRGKEK